MPGTACAGQLLRYWFYRTVSKCWFQSGFPPLWKDKGLKVGGCRVGCTWIGRSIALHTLTMCLPVRMCGSAKAT